MAGLLVVSLVRREGPAGHEGGTAEGRGEGEAEDQQGEGHLQAEEALLAVSELRFVSFVLSIYTNEYGIRAVLCRSLKA